MSRILSEDRRDRVCRTIGYALTLGDDVRAWDGLAFVLQVRLTPLERCCMLAALIRATHIDDVFFVLDALQFDRLAGAPLPVLDRIEQDAAWWAGTAGFREIEAMLIACFARLPARKKRGFLEAASRRVAA